MTEWTKRDAASPSWSRGETRITLGPVTNLAAQSGDGFVTLSWSAASGSPWGVDAVPATLWHRRGASPDTEPEIATVDVPSPVITYEIQRSGDGGDSWLELQPTDTLTADDTTVAAGARYLYRVRATQYVSLHGAWSTAIGAWGMVEIVTSAMAPPRFLASGIDDSDDSMAHYARSDDGVSWTDLPMPPVYPHGSFEHNGRYWVLGDSIAYSDDLETWTMCDIASTGDTWAGMVYAPELSLFVAWALWGTAPYYSSDGIHWFAAYIDTTDWGFRSVAWNGSRFVAAGLKSGANNPFATSTNGTYWTCVPGPATLNWSGTDYAITHTEFYSVVWLPWANRFVAAGSVVPNTHHTVAYSSDGVSWTYLATTVPISADTVCAGSSNVVVGGWDDPSVAMSSDGESWGWMSAPASQVECLVYNGGRFVSWVYDTTYNFIYSDNGETWAGYSEPMFAYRVDSLYALKE